MVAEREEEKMESQSPEVHRQQIKQWMTEKFAERQNEYQQHRRNLQEREVRPYRPASEVSERGRRREGGGGGGGRWWLGVRGWGG